MSVAGKTKTVYALTHVKPASLSSPGDFFLNELDAHAAKSRHRLGMEVFSFDAPQDAIDDAKVNGNLHDSVIHLEIAERITLLKNTLGDDPERVMARAEMDFAAEIAEQPANRRILRDTLTSVLPAKQAARAMINYTGTLARKLINEHGKARTEMEKFNAYYQPDAILKRTVDTRSQQFNLNAQGALPNTDSARKEFEQGRAAYYQMLSEKVTDCEHSQMTSVTIDGNDYDMNIEFDYNNMSQDPNNINGIEVGYMSLTGPIKYTGDDTLDVQPDPNMATHQIQERDAKKLLLAINSADENPTLVAEMVNHARSMKRPAPKPHVDLDLDLEMKMGRI